MCFQTGGSSRQATTGTTTAKAPVISPEGLVVAGDVQSLSGIRSLISASATGLGSNYLNGSLGGTSENT